jgi:hypothetical protein
MPVDVLTLPLSSINTKWKEPHASTSLNAKLVGVIAPGIYRGLRLIADPSLGDRTVVVQADVDKNDHVAVYESDTGYSITYRDSTSGDITLSLASYASVNVVICVFITYATGVSTSGSYRVYTEAEFAALSSTVRDHLVILGTVTVPASGAISSGNISLLRRTLASSNFSSGSILNAPLVKNADFEVGETNATHARSSLFWDKSVTVGTGTWKTDAVTVDSGMKSIELNVTAGPVTGELSQQIGVQTVEGQLFLVSVRIQQRKTITSGSLVFFMEWSDVNDALLTTTTQTLDGAVSMLDFRTVEAIIPAPAGAASLRAIGVRATAFSPFTTGVFGYIDGVNVDVEPVDAQHPYPFDQAFRRNLTGSSLSLLDKAGTFSSTLASLRFDPATPTGEGRVLIEPYDSALLPPALAMLGRIHKLGSGLLATEANALKPRIEADISVVGGSEFTLMWQSARNGESTGTYTQPVVRVYSSSDGQWAFTSNAIWGGATWTKDVAGQKATKMALAKDGLLLYTRVVDAAWSDASWDDTIRMTNPLSSVAEARTPRIQHGLYSGAITDFTLISEYSFPLLKIRVYASTNAVDGAKIMATVNASWDGANWNRDTAATGASRVVMSMVLPGTNGGSTWSFQFIDATVTATWTEATFSLSTNTQASINQYGAHFSNQAATQAAVYVGPDESFVNDGGVFFQISLNRSYYTIAGGRAASQYIYYPAPQVAIGWKLTGWHLIYDKQDTGGVMQGLLINAKDRVEATATGASTINSVLIAGLTTAGYYRMGETGLTVNAGGFVQSIAVPNQLTTRPDIHYLRVFPSFTATGGTDKVFGVNFYYTYAY